MILNPYRYGTTSPSDGDVALSNPTDVRLSDGLPTFTITGTSIGATLTDVFSYDYAAPTSNLPIQIWIDGSNFYHANDAAGETVVLTWDITSPVTLSSGQDLVFDIYGRDATDYPPGATRSDDFDVVFLSSGSVVGNTVTPGILSVAPYHQRVTTADASVPNGTIIDQIRINGRRGNSETKNYFTLAEVRAALVT